MRRTGDDGKIEVKDDANDVVRGAALGAVGGADELKTTATSTV